MGVCPLSKEHRRPRRPTPTSEQAGSDDTQRSVSRPARLRDDVAASQAGVTAQRGDPAQQAALLDLQRAAGNSAVVGKFRGDGERQVSSPTVQRAPTRTTEFVPVVAPSGPTAPLKVFSRYTHTWRMANAAKAPRGTSFHWGFGVDPNGIGRLLDSRSSRNGSSTELNISVRRPGQLRIQGTPVHQVPGGPQVIGGVRWAELPVAAPTLTPMSIMPRKPDGSGADTRHLSPGDKLIVRVRVGNVDGRRMEDPTSGSLVGPGSTNVDFSPDFRPVQSFPDGRSYDVELTAVSPGSFNVQLELGIGDADLGRGPKVQNISGDIEMDRQEFLNRCAQAHTKLDDAYTQANSIMEVLSAAYGNAYDRHDKTLAAQDASNRLAGEILLNAALAFVPGGVGGVVGGWMKAAKRGDFLVDAVKDLAKAGTRGIQGAIVPKSSPGAVMQPMGDDPRTWRAQDAVRVNNEKRHVLGILEGWQSKVNKNDQSFSRNFDPVAQMDQSLVRAGTPITAIPVPNQTAEEKTFELGMWKGWLEAFAYTVEQRSGQYGGTYSTLVENQGKKIRDRINALGEDGDAFLERHGGVARRRAQAEISGRQP
jgi:hypothetical protein